MIQELPVTHTTPYLLPITPLITIGASICGATWCQSPKEEFWELNFPANHHFILSSKSRPANHFKLIYPTLQSSFPANRIWNPYTGRLSPIHCPKSLLSSHCQTWQEVGWSGVLNFQVWKLNSSKKLSQNHNLGLTRGECRYVRICFNSCIDHRSDFRCFNQTRVFWSLMICAKSSWWDTVEDRLSNRTCLSYYQTSGECAPVAR